MRPHTLFAALVVLAATIGVAAGKPGGKQIRYVGVHPIAKGQLCHIEFPHVHVYGPAEPIQYREVGGAQHFVGDPVAYGWDGDRYSYYGHHPIYVEGSAGPVFCYLNGPHHHTFTPPDDYVGEFKFEGDAYFYVGTPPPVYLEARPAMVKINAIYEPMVYTRPVVLVEPPSAWIGIRYAMPAAAVHVRGPAVRGGAVVHGPVVGAGVEVVAPAVVVRPPSIEVGIGVGVGVGGGVIVGGGGHRHGKWKHKKWKRGKRRWR